MNPKLLLCIAVAVVLAGIGSSATLAASLSVAPAGNVTLTSLGKLSLAEEGLVFGECTVTSTSTLASGPITKVAGATVGALQTVTATECTNGTLTISGLPASLTYRSILGTLPEAVSGIALATAPIARLVTYIPTGSRCLYRGGWTVLLSTSRISGSRYLSGLMRIVSEASVLPLFEERLNTGFVCRPFFTPIGSFRVSPAQTITRS